MKIFEQIDRLQKINSLIENRCTGNAIEFAEKIGISRSHLFNYLDELKVMGAEIRYCTNTSTYCYENKIKVSIEQPIKITSAH